VARRIFWTEIAYQDLREAFQYIARDSANYAAAFADRVVRKVESLDVFPFGGRIVPEFENPTVRETYVDKYRLIYEVSDEAIHLIGVIHGARDLTALWEREGRKPLRP
jgi:toxin ParE1/3/4